jgi:hypothetical protein
MIRPFCLLIIFFSLLCNHLAAQKRCDTLQNNYVLRDIRYALYIKHVQEANYIPEPETDSISGACLEVLYTGKLDLYSFKDNLGRMHYFVESPVGLQEIYIHIFLRESVYTVGREFYHRQFVQVLKDLMVDCDKLYDVIEKTVLTKKSLVSLLKKYESCATGK